MTLERHANSDFDTVAFRFAPTGAASTTVNLKTAMTLGHRGNQLHPRY